MEPMRLSMNGMGARPSRAGDAYCRN